MLLRVIDILCQDRGYVLNSKSEYSRCRIPRLIIDKSYFTEREKLEEKENERKEALKELSAREIEGLGKQSQELLKRRTEDIDDHQLGGRKRKKRRFNVLEETWGLVSVEGVREIEEEGTHVKEGLKINHSEKYLRQTAIEVVRGSELIAMEILKIVRERAWMTLLYIWEKKRTEEEKRRKDLKEEYERAWLEDQLNEDECSLIHLTEEFGVEGNKVGGS